MKNLKNEYMKEKNDTLEKISDLRHELVNFQLLNEKIVKNL